MKVETYQLIVLMSPRSTHMNIITVTDTLYYTGFPLARVTNMAKNMKLFYLPKRKQQHRPNNSFGTYHRPFFCWQSEFQATVMKITTLFVNNSKPTRHIGPRFAEEDEYIKEKMNSARLSIQHSPNCLSFIKCRILSWNFNFSCLDCSLSV